MAWKAPQNYASNAIHVVPENIRFSTFTKDEIKKLCVKKITTPLTFDSLGHPLNGGLYDKALGPMTEKSEPCGTCGKNYFFCPGHFGYIELPLPVVNPIFHKIIGIIIKMSCLECYYIQIPYHIKYSLSLQIKLLNCGLVTQALEIESIINELISAYSSFENIPEQAVEYIKQYENLTSNTETFLNLNKNTEMLRNQFIDSLLKSVGSRKCCLYCKQSIDRVQALRNKIILTKRKTDSKVDQMTAVRANEAKYITPEDSRRYLREIWKNENELLGQMIPTLNSVKDEYPTDVFYFDVIPVLPINVRPVNIVASRMCEHPQSSTYKSIIQNCILLRVIVQVLKNDCDKSSLTVEAKGAYSYAQGATPIEKLNLTWETLQQDVDGLIDKDLVKSRDSIGLKQIIEKKAGIIRMHMMGKRVNYSARSVITPDPNLNIEEIGIPEAFAKKLTYPVPVTTWNVEELRKMIKNGPDIHPGAVMVENEDGTIVRINPRLSTQQDAILKRLLTPDEKGFKGVKKVHRHLCNGDVLLLNRQPTLHKPSIMAHVARILKGEKTLRLHYANCKAYNADFDGDEMNAHFPQNELARSEGYNIANVSNQYLVPKDGTPLSGLIQDHMISGVRLSLRGRFFSKFDYQQLVYQALSFRIDKIKLLQPSILKPYQLWSGKQILSTIIINIIPDGDERIHLKSTSKIGAKAWQTHPERKWKGGGTLLNDLDMSEAEVVIREGELLVGVLDKAHYGATPYGLVHCIYELYGGIYATRLLSSLTKLFTKFLQQEGFTLGVKDILTLSQADHKRRKIMKKSRKIGQRVITTALDLPETAPIDEIVNRIEADSQNPKFRAIIDRQYKTALDSYTNDINKVCLPAGLVCKFPENNLQLMVQSGAKGSTVNTMQISCLLGQIELEGKRPPLMICGKSLPSFPIFDFSPRAGGFIDGRFMTGIQPQEFFFHCMAGREGLIDTAVKTSRSGYLQRCLIKHLEGLTIGYDMTVRDSDESVIQFFYGEDGMDISKIQFLNEKQSKFLLDNRRVIIDKKIIKQLKHDDDQKLVKNYRKTLDNWCLKFGNPLKQKRTSPFTLFSGIVKERMADQKLLRKDKIVQMWLKVDKELRVTFQEKCEPCPSPVFSVFQPDHYFGALNERIEDLINKLDGNVEKSIKKQFKDMIKLKAMQSLCPPGEPVGLLAAQSIGEPSTQMTLNTFHFAGRGEMNVTLGIPRLREILMMASKNIKTPSMEVPFLPVDDLEHRAAELRKILTKVVVADILERIDVDVELEIMPIRQHRYKLKFSFLPKRLYKNNFHTSPKAILKYMEKYFFTRMFAAILKIARTKLNFVSMEDGKNAGRRRTNEDGNNESDNDERENRNAADDASSSSDEEPDDEDAKVANKFKEAHDDQEPENEEQEKSDNEDNEINDEIANDCTTENSVVDSYNFAKNYVYDKKKYLWCELTFALPLKFPKIDLTTVLRDVANGSVIWETSNIKRAITYQKNNQLFLRTDGINILEIFKHHKLLDLNKLHCNDIHKMAEIYGIEAATKIIVKEVKDVFNVYGIKVDPRHLSLIADYMTFNGDYQPFNRTGMQNSASPLQQMSFESSLAFLRNATVGGKQDNLKSPSSCLMIGKPCQTGTGCFKLMQKIGYSANN